MYLLNGVTFSIFILIRDYCTPLSLDGFPNAITLLSLSFEFGIKSGDAVHLLILSCRCDGFRNTVHCLFGPYLFAYVLDLVFSRWLFDSKTLRGSLRSPRSEIFI